MNLKRMQNRIAARKRGLLYNLGKMAKDQNYVLRVTTEFLEALLADALRQGFKRSPPWARIALCVAIGRPDLCVPEFKDIPEFRRRLELIRDRANQSIAWVDEYAALHLGTGEGKRHDNRKRK